MRNGDASIVRKHFYTCAVIGNFFCLLATASASEPTLQESIDFIRTKVGRSCEYRWGTSTDYRTNKRGDYRTNKTGSYTITLLGNKTILVKEPVHERRVQTASKGHNFPQDDGFRARSIEEIWLSTWTAKVRLADLSTDVEVNIPGKAARDVTARDIVVNCTKPACLEWKETNRTKTMILVAESEVEDDPDRRSESRLRDRQNSSSSYILFTICDQKDAEKIKKALTHAIRISGGKDELF